MKGSTAAHGVHKQLQQALLSNNIKGMARLYCHNYIERSAKNDCDKLLDSEVGRINAKLKECTTWANEFYFIVAKFKTLKEATYLVAVSVVEYKIELTQLAVQCLQHPHATEEEERKWLTSVADKKVQYCSIIKGVCDWVKANDMKHFIPAAQELYVRTYSEGRDVIQEDVEEVVVRTSARTRFTALTNRLPSLKDVKIEGGYIGTLNHNLETYWKGVAEVQYLSSIPMRKEEELLRECLADRGRKNGK